MAGKIYIFRGLPGSGKSTEAAKLQKMVGNPMIIEPDALLIDDAWWKAVRTATKMCDLAYTMGADVIYADVLPTIDDVERILWHFPGYEYAIFDMQKLTVAESSVRNTHRVRRCDLERMAATWEDWKKDLSGTVPYDWEGGGE